MYILLDANIDTTRYYKTSEDKAAADTFTDFWTTDGTLRIAGNSYQGYAKILAVKQNLLPKDGNKAWWVRKVFFFNAAAIC